MGEDDLPQEAENPFLGSIPHPEGSQHSTRHPGPYIPRPLSSTSSSSSSSSWSSALSTRHGRWLPASWFRKALDVAPANMFIVDKDMRLRYVSSVILSPHTLVLCEESLGLRPSTIPCTCMGVSVLLPSCPSTLGAPVHLLCTATCFPLFSRATTSALTARQAGAVP